MSRREYCPAFTRPAAAGTRRNRDWRRAKFGGRFRLFFRYHSDARIIAYVWLNDEHTLRKAGSRTDAYATFKAMLENDRTPSGWDELIAAYEMWPERETLTADLGNSDAQR